MISNKTETIKFENEYLLTLTNYKLGLQCSAEYLFKAIDISGFDFTNSQITAKQLVYSINFDLAYFDDNKKMISQINKLKDDNLKSIKQLKTNMYSNILSYLTKAIKKLTNDQNDDHLTNSLIIHEVKNLKIFDEGEFVNNSDKELTKVIELIDNKSLYNDKFSKFNNQSAKEGLSR